MSTLPSIRVVLSAVIAAACCVARPVSAQMPGSPGGVSASLVQIFGANTNFTARVHMDVISKSKEVVLSGPMDFAIRDGNVRLDVDLSKLKGRDIPAAASGLKEYGMEKLASIVRTDKKELYVLYPSLEAVLVTPMSKTEIAALTNTPKRVETELGKETLNGVACVKKKVVVESGGQTQESLVWTAPALKDFPMQIETTEKDNTLIMKFSDVKLTKPDAKQFEVGSSYTKYNSPEEMMQGALKKMMGLGK